MASKVGKLIKEARQAADLTQEKLAKKVGGGLTAADISKAERGELELPLATLRKIAKATGVTQASLVNAAQGKTAEKKTTTKKTAAKKTEKKADEKKAEEKKTEKKAKTPTSANKTMKVTATEQKLINAYRLADSATKKAAMNLLQGESNDLVNILLGSAPASSASKSSDNIADMLGDAIGSLLGGK